MKYKFLGQPDKIFPDLIHGKIYDLKIEEISKGFLGWLVGNTRPMIIEPIRCPYSSWETFYRNWELVKEGGGKMKHIFWFQHDWRAVGVKKAFGSIINRLNFEKEAENVPMTEVLYRCGCGAVKTETIKGHWRLNQIK